ncbi:MAG: hypothetical protein M0P77_01110 [Firmicutes bacterium]|nr:hypothetical protein [Bacillota bacterium]
MQQAKSDKKNKAIGKKHSKLQNFFLVIVILFLTSIIAIAGIFFFNIGGGKTIILKTVSNIPLIGNILKPVVENKTPEELKEEKLQAEKSEIALQTKQLEEKIKEIEEKENDLAIKEKALEKKEKTINERLKLVNEKLNSVEEQVEYFEKMNPANASLILSNMESKGAVVQILRNMSKDKSSKILTLMDPLQAAQILEEIKELERFELLSD